jgi:uncharacterized repeat protein (TIGR02543 family)
VIFEDVNVDEGVVLKESDSTVILEDRQGQEIGSEEIGYSVVFYSLGGTPVEAAINIAPGSPIDAPPDPELPGYSFKGWYTDTDYTEQWDFFDPVTSDMILYALWEEDDPGYTLGDVNGSGTVTMTDATLIYQHYRGKTTLTGNNLLAADVNGSGTVTMADATLVYQYYRGKITTFPTNEN